MPTNNDIRRFLGKCEVSVEFDILQVDSLSANRINTLMFLVKRDDILVEHLNEGSENVILVDEELFPQESEILNSKKNDFIKVKNPKYKFCLLVEKYGLKSFLQNTYTREEHWSHVHKFFDIIKCREFFIGNNCSIDEGVILGGTDFSPVLGDDGTLVQFPQLGGIKIGDNVVIKYNSMIGKGTFGFTSIGNNTMIDYGCQIGHNCIIGDSCIIAAGSIVGGSTTIGNHTVIGIGAKIRNGLSIGNNVSIGMGSVVIRDIPDNSVVVGNPARIIEHKKIFDKKGLI